MENQNNGICKIMVTGGLGFIGSHFIELALSKGFKVINVDNITYASRKDLNHFNKNKNYEFIKKDICDLKKLPDDISHIINFAAESHVDNSIKDSLPFIKSNIQGVYNMLELVRKTEKNKRPVFIQISTDEVYGDIPEGSFTEKDKLSPSNPYSATKAAADHLVAAWGRTYDIKYKICRSCNNYGYAQRAEKLIPKTMKLAPKNIKVGIHGNGQYKREWIYVGDNCEAIFLIMDKGKNGEIYNISTGVELTNIEVVKKVLKVVNKPEDFYEFAEDRPGHSIGYEKIKSLGWKPRMTLDEYLPICYELNEARRRALPPGRKKKLLRFIGLDYLIK